MRDYRNTTAHLDMPIGPARAMYFATIDVMDMGRKGFAGDLLPNSGPVASWIAENIIDAERLGLELSPRSVY